MEIHQLIGIAVLVAAVAEAILGLLVVGPKAPPEKRAVITAMMLFSALVMAGLGVAFLMKWIPVGGKA